MSLVGFSVLALLGAVAGMLIGCIGVGGIILVPALVQLGGIPIHDAISSAMAGYILTGCVGTRIFFRKGTVDWAPIRTLWAGAIPAAIFGSLVAKATPPFILEIVIALMMGLSGLSTLAHPSTEIGEPTEFRLSIGAGVAIGMVTGFLSALTGTGGPAVLIPILFWLEVPVLIALGLAQGIQLPIAVLASVGNAAEGMLSPLVALALGVGLALGAWFGARLAHALDQRTLRRIVAVVLFGTGLLLLFRITYAVIGEPWR